MAAAVADADTAVKVRRWRHRSRATPQPDASHAQRAGRVLPKPNLKQCQWRWQPHENRGVAQRAGSFVWVDRTGITSAISSPRARTSSMNRSRPQVSGGDSALQPCSMPPAGIGCDKSDPSRNAPWTP